MNELKLPFGKRIKELRDSKGWKQTDLAEKSGIDRNMISYYENEKYTPSAEALIKFAEVFDISIDYLLFEDVQIKPLHQKVDSETLKLLIEIDKLDTKDKEMINHMISSLITKNKVKDLVASAS